MKSRGGSVCASGGGQFVPEFSRLIRYVEDGRFEIDNNLIENSIRPVALGRKNYMFAGSHEGVKRSAILYSMMGTCKMREINPFTRLNDYLSKIPDWPANRVEELFPGAGYEIIRE